MSEIHVKENESIDSALKRFKRSCAKAGVLAEVYGSFQDTLRAIHPILWL